MVSFKLLPLYYQRKTFGGWVGLKAGLKAEEWRQIFYLCKRIYLRKVKIHFSHAILFFGFKHQIRLII
jgi:hypothetical protein